MASIKDAFEESIQDNMTALKCFIYAIPLYYTVHLYITSSGNYMAFGWMAAITFILLFGFMLQCTSNVRNGRDQVLPSINIFSLYFSSIKGLIALGPSIALNCWLATLVIDIINTNLTEPKTALTFKIITWFVFGSIILTGYMLYSKNFKISDAYNLKIISETSMDIMIKIIFMIPGVLVVNGIFVGAVTYIFWIFFGIPNMVCTFFWCIAGVFNLAMIGHYIAQLDYESIPTEEKDNKF